MRWLLVLGLVAAACGGASDDDGADGAAGLDGRRADGAAGGGDGGGPGVDGALAPDAPTGAFVHPGLHVSRGQLDVVKAKIAAGQQPWTGLLARARSSSYGNVDWVPQPVVTMRCGNGGDTTDLGCSDSRRDALAAYTLALIYVYTGEAPYAAAAMRILDAYATTLDEVVFTSGDTSTYNGPLQAAWLAELFPRAAELIRYSDAGWPEADARAFGDMLVRAILPRIRDDWYGGGHNWNTSMANGTINIGVYTDSREIYDVGVAIWRENVPFAFYLATDGATPIPAPDFAKPDGTWKDGRLESEWYGQVEFGARENGMVKEVCRDLTHTQFTLASVTYGAETAWIQGLDLYAEQQTRIVAAHEFVGDLLDRYAPSPGNDQATVTTDAYLCDGELIAQVMPTFETVTNHYVHRRGVAMPRSLAQRAKGRAGGPYTDLMMSWETLTHGDVDAP